jgi:RNA polymerase-binding transcription factor DksA
MLTQSAIDKYPQHLLNLRRHLDSRVAALRGEILATEQPDFEGAESEGQLDMGALAGHAFEHEINAGLFGTEEQLREEIEAALKRIAKGTFGRCTDCAKPISRVRLNLVPYARQCMACAKEFSPG